MLGRNQEQVLRELLSSVESEELRGALEQECRDFSRRMSAMDQEVERKVGEIKESDQQYQMLTQVSNENHKSLCIFFPTPLSHVEVCFN